jgi:hypothetical protein
VGLEVWTNVVSGANHVDPWPRRVPAHGARGIDGVPNMVHVDRRDVRVWRVLNTYNVFELGLGLRGTAWQLQPAIQSIPRDSQMLADYADWIDEEWRRLEPPDNRSAFLRLQLLLRQLPPDDPSCAVRGPTTKVSLCTR